MRIGGGIIKRPLLGAVLFVFAGELIYLFAGRYAVAVCFILILMAFGCFYYRKKIWAWYIIFPALFMAGALRTEYAAVYDDIVWGEEYELTGRVSKVVEKEDYAQIYMYNGLKGILLYSYDDTPDLLAGDVISCTAKLLEFEAARNPGNFDSKSYYLSCNIICRANVSGEITVIKPDKNIWIRGIFALKSRLSSSYEQISVDNDAGIYKSIVLGDKTELDSDIKELYRLNGMAHILAISGLHISIIGLSIYKMLRKCCIPFAPAAFICTVLIASYGIMTGSSVSAIRAIIMFLLSVYANVCGRRYDLLSAVSFSAAVTMLIYPYVIYNSGFWLSYTAVLGIVLLKPVFDRFFKLEEMRKALTMEKKKEHGRINKRMWLKLHILDSFDASLAVSLMTLPVILCSYYELALYSVLLNMLVIPLMTFVMLGAVLGGLAGLFWTGAGVFFAGISHYVLQLYETVCRVFMKLPGSVLTLGKPYWWEIMLFYLLIALVIVLTYVKSSKYALAAVISGIVLAFRVNESYVRMLDVGQGECIHISYAPSSIIAADKSVNILIDGGSSSISNVGEYRILPYLKSIAVNELDYVMVSHADSDHVSGLLELISSDTINIKCFVMPYIADKTENYLKVEQAVLESGIDILYMAKGDSVYLSGGGLEISCVHPDIDYAFTDENDYSLVLNVKLDGTKFLFTGDIGQSVEDYILSASSALSDIDVLKVAHHGSKYSSSKELLDAVKAETALISAGINNRYSHPHKETLARLSDAESEIYSTSTGGALTVKTKNSIITVESYIK